MRFVAVGGLLMASVERPLSAPPTVGYGSFDRHNCDHAHDKMLRPSVKSCARARVLRFSRGRVGTLALLCPSTWIAAICRTSAED